MKANATWRRRDEDRRFPLPLAFALAMLLGGKVDPDSVNPNRPGTISPKATDADIALITEEGRRQLDAQSARLDRVDGRAQALLTVSLAVLAFSASAYSRLDRIRGSTLIAGWVVWIAALALIIAGTVLAAAVIVVRADFDAIDTTQMSLWTPPLNRHLAGDYASAVILGETTVAARITIFRLATRLVSWAAILTSILWIISE